MNDSTIHSLPSDPEIESLLALAHQVGADRHLVQPGGGNISLKRDRDGERWLFIKGSGADLATLQVAQLTRLSLDRLGAGRSPGDAVEDDVELTMRLRRAMLRPEIDPEPSLETPLHAAITAPVVLHTHDLVTLALTNQPEKDARGQIREIFGGRVLYLPYARPGAPLAHRFATEVAALDDDVDALMLAHHGLVTWGASPADCRRHLDRVVETASRRLDEAGASAGVFGEITRPTTDPATRRRRAVALLPVVRRALEGRRKRILHLDDSAALLDTISRRRFADVAARGMATPDHILWAGRCPAVLDVEPDGDAADLAAQVRHQLGETAARDRQVRDRHLAPGVKHADDGSRIVMAPGLGVIAAADDARQARTAAGCFAAGAAVMAAAESLGGYRPLAEADAVAFEHWPLERRKMERLRRHSGDRELAGHVVLIVGGGSGIGEAAAASAVAAGAHVVIADLDTDAAGAVASRLEDRHPGQAVATAVDVRDDASLTAAVEDTVLRFGGLDGLFYTAGRAPSFARIVDITREELSSQMEIHYLGALIAMREAARVMRRQGGGGSIVCSVSKAALAPGKEAAAYGGSKAALQHAVRIAALELGEDDIRVNAINADQVDTPLFRRFVEARARAAGRTVDQQLASYRSRNALGRSLIPAGAVGDLVALLLGPRFRHTTGDILTVDGGLPDAFPR